MFGWLMTSSVRAAKCFVPSRMFSPIPLLQAGQQVGYGNVGPGQLKSPKNRIFLLFGICWEEPNESF
jgi:hypothetical protein